MVGEIKVLKGRYTVTLSGGPAITDEVTCLRLPFPCLHGEDPTVRMVHGMWLPKGWLEKDRQDNEQLL